MTVEDEIQLGESARAVIENEAFVSAFDTLTQELTQTWQNSPAKDAEGREKLYLMLKLTHKVRLNLESLVTNGKMAQEKKRSLLERAKSSLPEWMSGSD